MSVNVTNKDRVKVISKIQKSPFVGLNTKREREESNGKRGITYSSHIPDTVDISTTEGYCRK